MQCTRSGSNREAFARRAPRAQPATTAPRWWASRAASTGRNRAAPMALGVAMRWARVHRRRRVHAGDEVHVEREALRRSCAHQQRTDGGAAQRDQGQGGGGDREQSAQRHQLVAHGVINASRATPAGEGVDDAGEGAGDTGSEPTDALRTEGCGACASPTPSQSGRSRWTRATQRMVSREVVTGAEASDDMRVPLGRRVRGIQGRARRRSPRRPTSIRST